MEGVLVFRIPSPTLDGFRAIARRDGRTPSNLARKLVTDFVRSSQMEAVAQ